MRIRLLGHHVHASIAVLSAIEAVLFFIAIYAATLVNLHVDLSVLPRLRTLPGALWPRAALFSLVMLVSLLAFGLYNTRQRARFAGIALRVALAFVTGLAITVVLFYLVPDLWIGADIILLAGIAGMCGVVLSRVVFTRVVDENIFKRRVIVYGAGESAAAIDGLRRRADRRGFMILGFIPSHPQERTVKVDRILDTGTSLVQICNRLSVNEVVVAMDDRRQGFPIAELLQCRLAGIDVTELLTFLERETGRVRIDVLNPSWMIFGQGFRRGMLRRITSRMLDLVASVAGLALASPFMLVTALAIKLEDGWRAPLFYRQRRVGLGGESFNVLKFRSMRTDAESDGRARWAQYGDPRVTRVGSFIRKVRIDELPQLLNVLYGQMSLVGPRPERPEFVAQLAERIPYYVERHCVKPGVTGWAQLCYPYGSSEQDSLEKLQYDLYYVKNNSLLFDLTILLQTVEVVLFGKGS
jgi:sugar transferase (PEP-CTERM system associated)